MQSHPREFELHKEGVTDIGGRFVRLPEHSDNPVKKGIHTGKYDGFSTRFTLGNDLKIKLPGTKKTDNEDFVRITHYLRILL